jgi:ATP-dependent helicase/nuclease subunit A
VNAARSGFSEEQQAAIRERNGALALAANAGSGKTSVLVERFAQAVIEDGVAPSRILAITFTDRAAGELRTRVRQRLIAAGRRDAASEAATAFISTFHAFAARVLRAHPLLTGLAPDFTVLDDGTTATLREQAFQLALGDWLQRDGALDLGATFGAFELAASIHEIYSERRSRGEQAPRLPPVTYESDLDSARERFEVARKAIAAELALATLTRSVERALERLERAAVLLARGDPKAPAALAEFSLPRQGNALCTPTADAYEAARVDYEKALADQLALTAVPLLDELLGLFGKRFSALKTARGGVDYDDLELCALGLLREHPDVAAGWRERFERLMVDELQDTNDRQMAILELLDRDDLFTVGDAFQAIYAFRHADVRIFRERLAALAGRGRALVLSTNYRSRAPIIDAVNAVFAPIFGTGFVPLRAGRADAERGAPVELLLSDTDGLADYEAPSARELGSAALGRRAEARLLAARIDALIAAGAADPADVVVLTRASTEIDVYEAAIRDRGYATLSSAGEGFYGRQEIGDLAAYMQALANPRDELALYGALASPLCGADSGALVALALHSRERQTPLWASLEAVEVPAISAFAKRFAAARETARSQALGTIVADAITNSGYEHYLAQLSSPERRIANVRKLIRLAREFERREGRDLRRFADALSAGRIGGLREAEAPPPVADAIRLMTVHAAKGLEFPVVALADLGHQVRIDMPRLLADATRVGLRLPNVERRRAQEALDYRPLLELRRAAEAAEEKRIYYVAMTRARERLIVSGAARFAGWPRADSCAVAWLAPALVDDLDRHLAAPSPDGVIEGTDGVPVRLSLARAGGALPLEGPRPEQPIAESGAVRASPRVPPAGGGGEARLSYTSLAEYERCGYRYYLQRVLALPDTDALGGTGGGGRAAADRGILVHALLEELDFNDPLPPDPARIASAALAGGIALTPDEGAEIVALAGAFAESPLCSRLALARRVRREEPFAFAHDGELIRGVIDACGIEADGTLLIVDYKTDRLSQGEALSEHIERDYGLQRLIYALAGLCSGAERVEVAYCFLRAPLEPVTSAYLATGREPLEAALRERLAPLRAGRFEVTALPGRQRCATCPGRLRLCSYDESLTLREWSAPTSATPRESGR